MSISSYTTGGCKRTVAVDGATGYLGNHLVFQLRQDGYNVRALVHPGAGARDVQFLQSCGAEVITVSLESGGNELTGALSGCDAAIHLIGSIAPRKGERLEDLHGTQTQNLVQSAKAAGVQKIVQVTALGTAANAKNGYHATKWLAEEHVRNSGITFVILRPSLIIGRQVGNRDSKLVMRYFDLIKTRPAVPVIGGGSNKIQPVFVGDLVQCMMRCIGTDHFDNGIYEIGGNEVLAMREFVAKLIKLTGSKKTIRAVPVFAAGIMAAVCETFQDVPLVSKDQIKLSTEDNLCRDNALTARFAIPATTVDNALATYSGSPDAIARGTSGRSTASV